MPHVIVKLYSGRSEQQKQRIADEVTAAIIAATGSAAASISVSIEDVDPADWAERVYKPEIAGRPDRLYKQPGYRLADLGT